MLRRGSLTSPSYDLYVRVIESRDEQERLSATTVVADHVNGIQTFFFEEGAGGDQDVTRT